MSIYLCHECDEYRDVDSHGCREHPNNEWECICEACEEKLILVEV